MIYFAHLFCTQGGFLLLEETNKKSLVSLIKMTIDNLSFVNELAVAGAGAPSVAVHPDAPFMTHRRLTESFVGPTTLITPMSPAPSQLLTANSSALPPLSSPGPSKLQL